MKGITGMDEKTSTPGPWVVVDDQGSRDWREIRTPDKRGVVMADQFYRTQYGETEAFAGVRIKEADARLIAAAPDLLTFANEFLEWVENHAAIFAWIRNNDELLLDDEGFAGLITDAQSFVKKARGES